MLICSSLIHLFCSNQMSDCERFDQIAQDKWATVCKSLRLLKTNERLWANRSGRSPKMSELLVFLSESLIISFFCKKIAIRSENRWANSQPWPILNTKMPYLFSFDLFYVGRKKRNASKRIFLFLLLFLEFPFEQFCSFVFLFTDVKLLLKWVVIASFLKNSLYTKKMFFDYSNIVFWEYIQIH